MWDSVQKKISKKLIKRVKQNYYKQRKNSALLYLSNFLERCELLSTSSWKPNIMKLKIIPFVYQVYSQACNMQLSEDKDIFSLSQK